MIERGCLAAVSRVGRRALQLYAAHILVVLVYIAVIAGVSREFHDPDDLNRFNVAVFIGKPLWEFVQALTVTPLSITADVLPLYILLLGFVQALALRYRPVNLDVLRRYGLQRGSGQRGGLARIRKPALTLVGSM